MPAKEAFPPTDGRSARAEEIDRARGALSTAHFGGAASESLHPTGESCEDDDEGVRRAAKERGHPEVTGCVDVGGYCGTDDPMGNGVRRLCCVTCTAPSSPRAQSLPPSGGGPVDLYLLAGQSGCVGLSSVSAMRASKNHATLDKEQSGVWFAGYRGLQTPENFAIVPMSPGVGSGGATTFGPELSLGERLHALTGRPVVLMKYCWGGSDVQSDWNPSTWENGWDRSKDNGTAAWLLSRGGANLGRRVMVFKNWVYTYRRTTEALTAAGVKVHTKGLFWMQGAADDRRMWYEYGVDETRAIDALRCSVDQHTLPVVSQGSNYINQLRSGKALTQDSVEGCAVAVLETALASQRPEARCQPGPTDPCLEGLYINFDVFEFFGYDPKFPAALKPAGATSKEFAWFCDMEHNLHAQYDAQVLLGRDLADAFVRQFSSSAVPKAEHDQDSAMLFPWEPCEPGQRASPSHQCWDDLRPRSPQSLAAGDAPACRPVPAEAACLMMDSYTGAPFISPVAIVACSVVAVAIAVACALRIHTWTKRRGFATVGGGD